MKGVLLLCVGALLLQCGYSQNACERLTLADLGSTTAFTTTGLVSQLITLGADGSLNLPPVRVTEMQIVCEAQHQMQNRYRYTSVVVRFSCDSTDDRLSDICTPGGTNSDATQQFDLGCVDGAWNPSIFQVTDFARTADPTATLTTSKDSGCSLCINPQHPTVASSSLTVDSDTHCVDCPSTCDEGLERCSSASACCNYFYQGLCRDACPGQLTGVNDDFECRCVELSDDNGEFSYSDGQNVGSIATLDCNDGYSESTDDTAECMESGWSATPVCNRVDCGDVGTLTNGELSYSDGTYAGSVVTYMCNTEYLLEGASTRMCQNSGTWTLTAPTCTACDAKIASCVECQFDDNDVVTCDQCEIGLVFQNGECQEPGVLTDTATACPIGCIIAIVLSIIAVIIIAIVLAVVAFVLYKYLSDPSTKLAQAGAGGLNGVARDNPLYVDPATVTEEGIDGVENGVTETTPLDS